MEKQKIDKKEQTQALTDAFENFTNRSLENYGLCLSHYLGITALIWDAMLSMNKLGLHFISDIWRDLLFENIWEVVFFFISKRYSNKVNNKSWKPNDSKNQQNNHLPGQN